MECYICKSPITLNKMRKNNYAHANCQQCHWQSAYWIDKQLVPSLSWLGRRFAYNGTTWHATYRLDKDQTTYKKVSKKTHPEDRPQEISYPLPSLVLTDRFITLLPFL